MSQRRGGAPKDAMKGAQELKPFTKSIEPLAGGVSKLDRGDGNATEDEELSLEERFEVESENIKVKLWRENPFAVGLTEATWAEEFAKYKKNPAQECLDTSDSDGMPCICCSAAVCSVVGAGRVGNMAVLKQSMERVEEVEQDENGEEIVRRFTRPKLDIVIGPYWPMLCCVTYPLILGVSALTLVHSIPGKHPLVVLVWAACTIGLIYALSATACRDPGILPRYHNPPPQNENNWRWSDRALTYRPRGAFYDPDTAVVVEGFDHTCPWTGTAIGRRNMSAFQCFVGLVFICLMFDIILLTGGIR